MALQPVGLIRGGLQTVPLGLLYVADGRISPDKGFIIATLAGGRTVY